MMTDQERREIVLYRLEKAANTLEYAQRNLNYGMYSVAANRLYYAFYYAASALLISVKIEAHSHSGVQSMMHLHFVKTGIIEDRYGAFLTRMEQLREKGDYNCLFEVTKEELLTFVEPAKELVEKIRQLIA